MSVTRREERVSNEAQLHQLLQTLGPADTPTLLLSASVPYWRGEDESLTPAERAEQVRLNQRYMATAQPERIRRAVKELTESALIGGARLIFGAHPAISPMVLEAAQTVGAPDSSILIFQSEFFRAQLPGSTLQLADWSAGILIFTPAQPGQRPRDARQASLTAMRLLMSKPRSLRGAVFVGGMEGTEEEARILLNERQEMPRYALANTGSAALDLFTRDPDRFCGYLSAADRHVLEDYPTSFKLVARRILDDMGIARPSGARP